MKATKSGGRKRKGKGQGRYKEGVQTSHRKIIDVSNVDRFVNSAVFEAFQLFMTFQIIGLSVIERECSGKPV